MECIKSKEKVLSKGSMFLPKKIQPILGEGVVKYVSSVINSVEGPKWLQDQTPEQLKMEHFEEPEIEQKKIKEILAITFTTEKTFDKLLRKFLLLKTLRVLSWISRFLSNSGKYRSTGSLTTNELLKEKIHY